MLARWLLLPAAVVAWRWSRLVSAALGLALVAEFAYDVAPWEPLRWISLVTGTMGLVELKRRITLRRRAKDGDLYASAEWARGAVFWEEPPKGYRDAPRVVVQVFKYRANILATMLVWSSLTDALALLWWRRTEQWGALPVLQTITLLAMIAVSVWPRRNRGL